jgi:hypothetical protein
MKQEAKQNFTSPLTFSQEELTERQEKARIQYLEGHYDHQSRDFVYPATELHSFTTLETLCDFVAEKALEGCPRFPGYIMRSGIAYYDIRVMKPKQQQEQELQALFEQVETDYRQELQDDLEAKKALLTEQLYQQQKTKELREQQKKEDAQRAKAAEEAEKYIQSLLNEVK